MLLPEYIIEGIRADYGFADPSVMSYAEEKGWYYIFDSSAKSPKVVFATRFFIKKLLILGTYNVQNA